VLVPGKLQSARDTRSLPQIELRIDQFWRMSEYSTFAMADDTQPRSAARQTIPHKSAQRVGGHKLTILDLIGELRNQIHHHALANEYQRVPLNPIYLNKPNSDVALFLTCSVVYHEACSYMTAHQTAYIPVLVGLDWTYGGPGPENGLSRATKDTTVCA
jgi:hypothetical protein